MVWRAVVEFFQWIFPGQGSFFLADCALVEFDRSCDFFSVGGLLLELSYIDSKAVIVVSSF